jgi:hypothetical protein
MAYGHAERNLATLERLRQQAEQRLNQQAREDGGLPHPPGEPAGESPRDDGDPCAPVPAAARRARHTR